MFFHFQNRCPCGSTSLITLQLSSVQGWEILSHQNEVHAVSARQKGEWTRKVKKKEKRGASKKVKVETAVSFLNLKSVLKFCFCAFAQTTTACFACGRKRWSMNKQSSGHLLLFVASLTRKWLDYIPFYYMAMSQKDWKQTNGRISGPSWWSR